jgi:hypothetical protein
VSTVLSPEYHQLTEAEQHAVQAWLRAHGIDPSDVPVDGIDSIGGQYRILVWQRTASGKRMADQLGGPVGVYEFRPAEPALPWPTRKTEETL